METSEKLGPLDGIRIVEFSHYIAAPSAAQLLVDQGAQVIKIEPPGGEAARHRGAFGQAMLDAYNRGKFMVSLDLNAKDDRESALRLIKDADVVITNIRPKVMRKFGLAPEQLRRVQPELITASVVGYASNSRYAGMPGYDIAAQAESGMMWLTGEADREPQRVGTPIVDAATGYVVAEAVCAALVGRIRNGVGAAIEVSLWDVAIHLQGTAWTRYRRSGQAQTRKGNGQPGMAPAADLYRAKDGYVVVSAYVPAHWRAFCSALELDDIVDADGFTTAEDRTRHREELTRRVEARISSFTRDEVLSRLSDAGVVAGGVREMPEVVAARGIGQHSPFFQSREGEPWYLGMPYLWEGLDAASMRDQSVGGDNERFFPAGR